MMYVKPLFLYPIYCKKLDKMNYILAKAATAALVVLPTAFLHMVASKGDVAVLVVALVSSFVFASYVEDSSCIRFVPGRMRAKLVASCAMAPLAAMLAMLISDAGSMNIPMYRVGLVLVFILGSVVEYIWSGVRFREERSVMLVQFDTWDLTAKNIGTWMLVGGGLSGLGCMGCAIVVKSLVPIAYSSALSAGMLTMMVALFGLGLHSVLAIEYLIRNRRMVMELLRKTKKKGLLGNLFRERVK